MICHFCLNKKVRADLPHSLLGKAVFSAAAAAKSLQSCPTLCNPIDGSPPGSPVPGVLQARTLEWVAISFSNAGKVKSESEVAQLCPTLRDPMDCSPPGSSAHGIFQARLLEWGATAFFAVCSRMPYSPATEEPICFNCIQLLCASQTVVFGLPASESPGMPV